MAVETHGTVRMRGDTGPGVAVRILADEGRLRITSGSELVGEWSIDDIGILVLNDGFAIKAEGEEFMLRATRDAELAEELRVAAAAPRLARKVAALHKVEDLPPSFYEPQEEEQDPETAGLMPIAYALAGVLVVLGGTLLQTMPRAGGGSELWGWFVIGGALMVMVALALALGAGWARLPAYMAIIGVIALFVIAASNAVTDAGYLTAYGFVAGGLVVGVAALFGGNLRESD